MIQPNQQSNKSNSNVQQSVFTKLNDTGLFESLELCLWYYYDSSSRASKFVKNTNICIFKNMLQKWCTKNYGFVNNYDIELNCLKKRFENKRAVISFHGNELLPKLPLRKREWYALIRKPIDAIIANNTGYLYF